MTEPAADEHLWIIGAGRAGLALGLLLSRMGAVRSLSYSGRRPSPPSHPLFAGPQPTALYTTGTEEPQGPVSGVLIAVPDVALPRVAGELAGAGLPTDTPVLHLSGALGAEVLEPLAQAGCSVGALHPLAAVADPVAGAERLRGVWWGVEAAGAARRLAERIVAAADGRVLPLSPGAKAPYHAAAVFASNYVVVLLGVAEAMLERAGIETGDARAALCALAGGAVANVAATGPAAALTGPVARGDLETLRLHLQSLSEPELALYSPLARAALGLARQRGLDAAAAEGITRLLEEKW
jgi:hypothetical protein